MRGSEIVVEGAPPREHDHLLLIGQPARAPGSGRR